MVWVDAIANQMKSDMQDVQVGNQILIAGAGPSGLALAAELSRRGVSAAIIDRQAAAPTLRVRVSLHARTMEVLEPLGVTRDLLAFIEWSGLNVSLELAVAPAWPAEPVHAANAGTKTLRYWWFVSEKACGRTAL